MSFDVHFAPLPEEAQRSGEKLFGFGFRSAVAVRGPQKLANRWMKTLFTPKGTAPLNEDAGTDFHLLLGANFSSQADVVASVLAAFDDCNNQLKTAQRGTTLPDDERLRDAGLEAVEPLGADGFQLHVYIENAAGERFELPLPRVGVTSNG